MRTAVLASNVSHPLSQDLRRLVEAGLDPDGPILAPLEQAESVFARYRPQALLVLLSPQPERALAAMGKVGLQVGGPVLAVGPTADPQIILKALQHGANHYLDENDLPKQFEAFLSRLQAQPREESEPAQAPGRIISILAASGGCGASTLAVNLAVVLAKERRTCALVDLKPGVGDLAALLDLKPTHTLADLCHNSAPVDAAMLAKAVAPHSSGVHLLAPPQKFDDIRLVSARGVQKALDLARAAHPFVVIDQEDCFHEEQILALRQADVILLTARLDFTSLRNTRRILDQLGELNVPREQVRVVINRHGQAKELPKEEVEQTLGLKLTHLIPEDAAAINGANNTGVPVVLKAPSSRSAQAIIRLGKSLVPAAPAAAAPPSKSRVLRWLAPFC
jgi:pilus assembly protein CpaE